MWIRFSRLTITRLLRGHRPYTRPFSHQHYLEIADTTEEKGGLGPRSRVGDVVSLKDHRKDFQAQLIEKRCRLRCNQNHEASERECPDGLYMYVYTIWGHPNLAAVDPQ